MPTVDEIRKLNPGVYGALTDYEVVDRLAQITGRHPEAVGYDLGVAPKNDPGFVTAAKSTIGSTIQGAGQLAGDFIPGVENNNSLERYGRGVTQRNPVTIMDGGGNALENIGTNLVESPWDTTKQIAGSALGLMVPGAAPRAAIMGGRALMGAKALGTAGKAGLATGEAATFGLPSYAQIRDTQEAKGQNSAVDLLKAGTASLAVGFVEKLGGVESMLGKGLPKPSGSLGKAILKNGAQEAGEEMVQTPIEAWGSNEDPLSRKTLTEAAAGGVAGFVGGGLFGAASHPMAKAKEAETKRKLEENQKVDILETQKNFADTYTANNPQNMHYTAATSGAATPGSFGVMNEFANFLNEEKADKQRRMAALPTPAKDAAELAELQKQEESDLAYRRSDLLGEQQKQRDLDAMQQQALDEGISAANDTKAPLTVEQANALTQAQGFDSTEPTAMELALRAAQQRPVIPQAPAAEAPQQNAGLLPNRELDPLLSFPDGSVGTRSQVEKFIAKLPENQRIAARAKLLGYAAQQADVKAPEATPLVDGKIDAAHIQSIAAVARISPNVISTKAATTWAEKNLLGKTPEEAITNLGNSDLKVSYQRKIFDALVSQHPPQQEVNNAPADPVQVQESIPQAPQSDAVVQDAPHNPEVPEVAGVEETAPPTDEEVKDAAYEAEVDPTLEQEVAALVKDIQDETRLAEQADERDTGATGVNRSEDTASSVVGEAPAVKSEGLVTGSKATATPASDAGSQNPTVATAAESQRQNSDAGSEGVTARDVLIGAINQIKSAPVREDLLNHYGYGETGEELSGADIAKKTNRSRSAITQNIQKGHRELGRILREQGHDMESIKDMMAQGQSNIFAPDVSMEDDFEHGDIQTSDDAGAIDATTDSEIDDRSSAETDGISDVNSAGGSKGATLANNDKQADDQYRREYQALPSSVREQADSEWAARSGGAKLSVVTKLGWGQKLLFANAVNESSDEATLDEEYQTIMGYVNSKMKFSGALGGHNLENNKPATPDQIAKMQSAVDVIKNAGWGGVLNSVRINVSSNTGEGAAGGWKPGLVVLHPMQLEGKAQSGEPLARENSLVRTLFHELTHEALGDISPEQILELIPVVQNVVKKLGAGSELVGKLFDYPFRLGDITSRTFFDEFRAELVSAYNDPKLKNTLLVTSPDGAALARKITNEIISKSNKVSHSTGRGDGGGKSRGESRGQTRREQAGGANSGGNSESPDADFKSRFAGETGQVAPEQSTLRYPIQNDIKSIWTDIGAKLKELSTKLLTNFQLVDQFGGELKSLVQFMDLSDRMTVVQQRMIRSSHDILENWSSFQRKFADASRRLNSVMHDATIQQIHPDEAFNSEANSHLSADKRAAYDDLVSRYNTLPTEAKAIYKSVKDLLASNWKLRAQIYAGVVNAAYEQQMQDAVKSGDQKEIARIQKKIDAEIARHEGQIKELKGPYFPLMRFGDYIVVAESKKLKEARTAMQEAHGDAYKALAKQVAEMEKDEANYQVHAFDRASDQQAMADKLSGTHEVRMTKGEQYHSEMRPATIMQQERLSDMLGAEFDKGAAKKVKDAMTEMFLASMPEHHALQRQIKRHGVQGASQDMIRSFAEAMEKDSFYLSRMQFMPDITHTMYQMKKESSADNQLRDVYNNVQSRLAMDYTHRRNPVISGLAKLSSIWHLGVAPSYLLTNMTQPWMITAPQLAGKFGAGKAFSAMRTAWVDSTKIISAGRNGEFFSFKDTDFAKTLKGDELEMAKTLLDMGKLDIANNVDTELFTSGSDPRFIGAKKAFNFASHNIELVNRLSTALATYRLERSRGATHEKATEKAREAIELTQLTYDDTNAAYFMKAGHLGGLNRMPMQFRKYQQGMIYLLVRNAQGAFKGDKEAQRAFGYMMAMQFATAGAVGIPLAVPAALLAAAFGPGDDDKDGDAATQVRNYLTDMLGPDAARAMWKGLPAMLGVDTSRNLGMGDLLNPLPMMRWGDVTNAKTGKDATSTLLFNMAGAPMGTVADIADGVLQAVGHGEWQKGAEKMMPKFLAAPAKAYRLGTEGLSTRSGNVVMDADKFDGWDLAIKAAGFSPTIESEHYQAQSAKEDTARAILDRRNEAIRKYGQAKLQGNDLTDAQQEVQAFNEDHPDNKITQSTLIKSVQTRKKDQAQFDEAGVKFGKKDKALVGIDRFAY